MEEKYFVVSDIDYPIQIFFNREKAFENGNVYVDSFDNEGEHITAYKLIDDEYIKDF